jgi:hypothetical protein
MGAGFRKGKTNVTTVTPAPPGSENKEEEAIEENKEDPVVEEAQVQVTICMTSSEEMLKRCSLCLLRIHLARMPSRPSYLS